MYWRLCVNRSLDLKQRFGLSAIRELSGYTLSRARECVRLIFHRRSAALGTRYNLWLELFVFNRFGFQVQKHRLLWGDPLGFHAAEEVENYGYLTRIVVTWHPTLPPPVPSPSMQLPPSPLNLSVAERVAYERGEQLGNSVGYQVRLEGVQPRQQGSILFCTTGVLLRKLQVRLRL